jgi:hypothetical protein
VKVRLEEIIKSTATVTYVSPGWNDEAVGTKGKVELRRLQKAVSSTILFSQPSPFLVEAIAEGKTLLLSRTLADCFTSAW